MTVGPCVCFGEKQTILESTDGVASEMILLTALLLASSRPPSQIAGQNFDR